MSKFSLTITAIKSETEDVVSLYFKKPKGFKYNAGDCVDIQFPDHLNLGKKTFSYASSPNEPTLFITYKKGISTYKQYMQNLQVGQILDFIHYGSNFVFHPGKNSIFIAGGVGVAPLRSMIHSSLAQSKTHQLILLYLNSNEQFPFKKELEAWSKGSTLKNYFIDSSVSGRISEQMLIEKIPDIKKNFDFYISGPPLMVDATIEVLSQLGLGDEILHTDSFDGYTEELE